MASIYERLALGFYFHFCFSRQTLIVVYLHKPQFNEPGASFLGQKKTRNLELNNAVLFH